MRAVDDPVTLPEITTGSFTAHKTTIQLEVGARLNGLLIWFSIIFVALVVGGVIG